MKRFSFKITSIFLSFIIIFTIVFCDYKRVSAFEWAVPSVTWEIAAPFLFGLLGITYVSEEGKNLSTEDEFFDYCEEQEIPGPDVAAWISTVCAGTLNQASNVWTAFKSWANGLINTTSSSISSDVLTIVQTISNSLTSINYTNTIDGVFVPSIGIYKSYYSKGVLNFQVELYDSSFVGSYNSGSNRFEFSSLEASNYLTLIFSITSATAIATYGSSSLRTWSITNTSENFYVSGVSSLPNVTNVHEWALPTTITKLFESLLSSISNLAMISAGATAVAIPDVITLPWDKVGENADSISKAIEGLIELVQEGVLDISDFMTRIQDILGVIVIDPTADIVIPETINPDTDEPVTPEDVVQDNISNSGFILNGLEKVFPFCLPYDLYNFVTLLVAEPEAPEIHYPIYDPTSGETLTIDIDFEDWEPIVILFRYIFDFLFIIGLILIARALVGGGDKA